MADLSNALDKAYDDHISKLFDVLCTSLAIAEGELTVHDHALGIHDQVSKKAAAYARFYHAAAIAARALEKAK